MTNFHRNTSYLRIGSFVITGIILLVIAIIVFGSGVLFKRVVYAETYFKESVQGLSEGSQVKYLGMDIGFVKEINAIDNVYPEARKLDINTHAHYIYVKIALMPKFYSNVTNNNEIKEKIEQLVAAGLRIRLAPQGLTGNSYLELDFFNPKDNPVLPINWKPSSFYIPSITSTLAYFTDNAQYLFNELRQIDIKKMAADIDNMILATESVMQRTDRLLGQTNQQLINTTNDLNSIMNNVNSLSEQMKTHPSSVFFGNAPPKLDPKKL